MEENKVEVFKGFVTGNKVFVVSKALEPLEGDYEIDVKSGCPREMAELCMEFIDRIREELWDAGKFLLNIAVTDYRIEDTDIHTVSYYMTYTEANDRRGFVQSLHAVKSAPVGPDGIPTLVEVLKGWLQHHDLVCLNAK